MPSQPTTEHLEPARTIIEKLGGVEVVAKITGKDESRVYRWMYSTARGGTNGAIPSELIFGLLDYAAAKGIKLRPTDFATNGQRMLIIDGEKSQWHGRQMRRKASRPPPSKTRSAKSKVSVTKRNPLTAPI
jgi:hypothetical protein